MFANSRVFSAHLALVCQNKRRYLGDCRDAPTEKRVALMALSRTLVRFRGYYPNAPCTVRCAELQASWEMHSKNWCGCVFRFVGCSGLSPEVRASDRDTRIGRMHGHSTNPAWTIRPSHIIGGTGTLHCLSGGTAGHQSATMIAEQRCM